MAIKHVLNASVGDPIWFFDPFATLHGLSCTDAPMKCEIESLQAAFWPGEDDRVVVRFSNGNTADFPASQLGKTLFLSEAEMFAVCTHGD